MIRKKERLYKAAKRYQTEDHWKKFKQYRAQVKVEIDKAHRKFIFDMLEVNGTVSNNTTTNQQDNYRIAFAIFGLNDSKLISFIPQFMFREKVKVIGNLRL